MEDKDRALTTVAEVQRLKLENTRLKAQLEEQKQRRRKEQKRAAALWERERDALLVMHSEMQDKLQKLKSEVVSVQSTLAESEKTRVTSEQEMKLWRKSANRYKKKVREQRHTTRGQ